MIKKVYVGGTFDLFHWGHVELFKKCSELGEVWVSLNTDEFCEEFKRKPVMTLAERGLVVASCKYVKGIVINTGGFDSKPAILQVMPKYIIHGDDWTGEAYMKQMGLTQEFLDTHAMELVYFPYSKGISTSDIIKRLK